MLYSTTYAAKLCEGQAFHDPITYGESEQLAHAEWLGLLLDREWSFRHDRKLATRLRFAKLRHHAVPEDVYYLSERGLDRALFMKLIAGALTDAGAASSESALLQSQRTAIFSHAANCRNTSMADPRAK